MRKAKRPRDLGSEFAKELKNLVSKYEELELELENAFFGLEFTVKRMTSHDTDVVCLDASLNGVKLDLIMGTQDATSFVQQIMARGSLRVALVVTSDALRITNGRDFYTNPQYGPDSFDVRFR